MNTHRPGTPQSGSDQITRDRQRERSDPTSEGPARLAGPPHRTTSVTRQTTPKSMEIAPPPPRNLTLTTSAPGL
uniref:Uncharacterized protein n=1 Tax=Arundo donax TaxID=35708 RepID=A0A0A8Z046_ARUDO